VGEFVTSSRPVFRGFVSSTFSDFTAERNALREHVFSAYSASARAGSTIPGHGQCQVANDQHFHRWRVQYGALKPTTPSAPEGVVDFP
jgi:hypothetical protein